MKNKLAYIKIILMCACFAFLAGFTHNRHKVKKIESIHIDYHQTQQIYIDESSVNKLLIQNEEQVKNLSIENLDLNLIETQVEAHPMVENAEVFLDIDRTFHVMIKQPIPLARVVGMDQYYIDSKGEKMPLSEHYSARVPIVRDLSEKNIQFAYQLIKYINQDLFLKQHITQIDAYPDAQFGLSMRNQDFKIFVGKAEELNLKFMNFKAFYVKAQKDTLLKRYKRINLQYGNQVVCEKFES